MNIPGTVDGVLYWKKDRLLHLSHYWSQTCPDRSAVQWLIQRGGQEGHGRPIWAKVPTISGQVLSILDQSALKCTKFAPSLCSRRGTFCDMLSQERGTPPVSAPAVYMQCSCRVTAVYTVLFSLQCTLRYTACTLHFGLGGVNPTCIQLLSARENPSIMKSLPGTQQVH